MTTEIPGDTQPDKPRRGRPPRPKATQEAAPLREPLREPLRAATAEGVEGRNGEILSRQHRGTSDPYAVPGYEIPEGWSYQWVREEVIGQPDKSNVALMHNNGWRRVPDDRHNGKYQPRGGLVLCERPKVLTDEAKMDDAAKARELVRAQKEALGHALPAGFSGRHAGVKPTVNATYQPGDAPRPRLEIDG